MIFSRTSHLYTFRRFLCAFVAEFALANCETESSPRTFPLSADIEKLDMSRNFYRITASSTQVTVRQADLSPRGKTMSYKLRYFAITLMLLITLSFTFERQAHAYVDPGSGLLIFQGISAVVSGALIYFRRRIKSLFTKSQPTTPSAVQPVNDPH
jgi:hypothetical protein